MGNVVTPANLGLDRLVIKQREKKRKKHSKRKKKSSKKYSPKDSQLIKPNPKNNILPVNLEADNHKVSSQFNSNLEHEEPLLAKSSNRDSFWASCFNDCVGEEEEGLDCDEEIRRNWKFIPEL